MFDITVRCIQGPDGVKDKTQTIKADGGKHNEVGAAVCDAFRQAGEQTPRDMTAWEVVRIVNDRGLVLYEL